MNHHRHTRTFVPESKSLDLMSIIGLALVMGAVGFAILYGLSMAEAATLDRIRQLFIH